MWLREVFSGQIKQSRLTKLKVVLSVRINSCDSCPSTVQIGWPNEQGRENIPSLSNSIRVQGPREVMSQLYRPPVLFALCSGSASARGAPTSSLEIKQNLKTHTYYTFSQNPELWALSSAVQLRSWGQKMLLQHRQQGLATGHSDTPYSQREREPVPPGIGSSSWVRFQCPKTLFTEQAQNMDHSRTIHTPNLGGKQPSRCVSKYTLLSNLSREVSLTTPRFAAADLQIQNPTSNKSITQ